MNEPLISVIIPAYNCKNTICQAINSALYQEVPLEVIVVDDCSKDGLKEVLKIYENDYRVRYVRNCKNIGVAESRNKGVELARGKYIAYLDGDDYWAEKKLEKQLIKMEETGAVICATSRELILPDGTPTGKIVHVKDRIYYSDILKHNSINCSSVLILKCVAQEFKMEHSDSHEDYIMWMKVLGKYCFACGIDEPLMKYRLGDTGKSGNKLHSAKMTLKAYKYLGFGFFKSLYCFICYTFNGIRKYYFNKGVKK